MSNNFSNKTINIYDYNGNKVSCNFPEDTAFVVYMKLSGDQVLIVYDKDFEKIDIYDSGDERFDNFLDSFEVFNDFDALAELIEIDKEYKLWD